MITAATALTGCETAGENPQLVALAQEVPPPVTSDAVLFRITDRELRFYSLPDLQDAGWTLPKRRLDVDAVVGFAPSSQQLFVLSDDSVLTAFDLVGGLVRTIDSSISMATVGANGVPLVVGNSGSVGSISQRQVSVWADSVALGSRRVWGSHGGRILTETIDSESRTLRTFSSRGAPTSVNVPTGPMAISRWAELVAVATPSAVELRGTRGESHDPSVIDVLEGPEQIVFSASGHQIFVTTSGGLLIWFDRFTGARLGSAPVGQVGQMRVGRLGRYLFIQQSGVDSVHVFDIHQDRLVSKLGTRWTNSIPSVAPNGTVLVRDENDILALDPNTFAETGRVSGGAADLWAVAAWTPVQPVSQRQAVEAVDEEYLDGDGPLYVQVSSSQNEAWAQELATGLSRAGLAASVLSPEDKEQLYRVVLGPFSTRDEAESAGRTLGRPYWIFSPSAPKDEL